MVAGIIAFLTGFFGFFKELTALFRKSPQTKIDDAEKDLHKEIEDVEKGGRPKWD